MKAPDLPVHEVGSTALRNSHSRTHFIRIGDQIIHSQLSPYSEAEIEERLRAYLNGPGPTPAMPAFDKAFGYSSRGGRGKKSADRIFEGDEA